MPKPLRQPPPTSSVARLLDLDAAARAVANDPPALDRPQPIQQATDTFAHAARAPLPTGEIPNVKRELHFTASSDDTLTRLVQLYRRTTGTRVTTSHVARAILKGVAHCFDQLERHAKKIGPLKLPANARGKELERERFEATIADAFVEGIRASAAMDDGSP